jgi:phage anti-repressor protein
MTKVVKVNSNLWKGKFKIEEMRLYDGLTEREINTVLEYQKLLPCLQEDNGNGHIDAKILHKQLNVGRKYTAWIKNRINEYNFVENEDYRSFWEKNSETQSGDALNPNRMSALGYKHEYQLTLDMAKELSMIENNDIGRASRKYFIAIEKAFKNRSQWNKGRQASIDTFHDLKQIIFTDIYHKNKLRKHLPSWWSSKLPDGRLNTYAYELYMLDLVIIGMSAVDYRKLNNIKKSIPIRNTFDEQQLRDFEMLQAKSAEYLSVNDIWNTNIRFEMIQKYYTYYKTKTA